MEFVNLVVSHQRTCCCCRWLCELFTILEGLGYSLLVAHHSKAVELLRYNITLVVLARYLFAGESTMAQKYPFKNLVFKGGGVKAFAYLGAIEVLESYEVLAQIKRVAGNSAGSIMATMISFRLGAEETARLFATMDYSKVTSSSEEDEPRGESRLPKVLQEGHERII